MSVIVVHCHVRDGLKPVHRRILYGLNEQGMTPDKSYKKSARICRDVMKYYLMGVHRFIKQWLNGGDFNVSLSAC